jgi:Protein of Unknown function (DUF2784)
VALLAALILTVHLLWLAFVALGALFTRGRPIWTTLHLLALVWGILAELTPWPCPLTLAENYLETHAGHVPYQGSFLLHYLDAIVYPSLPSWIVTSAGVAVCAFNLAIYARRWRKIQRSQNK